MMATEPGTGSHTASHAGRLAKPVTSRAHRPASRAQNNTSTSSTNGLPLLQNHGQLLYFTPVFYGAFNYKLALGQTNLVNVFFPLC